MIDNIIDTLYPIHKILNLKKTTSNIKCPSPDHDDKKPSAHIYNNRVWCFTCKRYFSVINIINFQKLNKNVFYKELEDLYGNRLEEEYNKNKTILKDDKKNIVIKKSNEDFINFTTRFFSS